MFWYHEEWYMLHSVRKYFFVFVTFSECDFLLLYSEECSSKSGVNEGSCASGFGVCCVSKYKDSVKSIEKTAQGLYIFRRYTFVCYILEISSSDTFKTFWQLHLRRFHFWMLHPRIVSTSEVLPSGNYTFGLFTFQRCNV